MNETMQTLYDLPEYEQEFAEAIIDHEVPIDRYRLSREGSIYKRLADKLLEGTL